MTTNDRPKPTRPSPQTAASPEPPGKPGVAARIRSAAVEWNRRMLAESDAVDAARLATATTATSVPRAKGTRWKRATTAIVPAGVAVTGMAVLMTQGVLAANFNASDAPFVLKVGKLVGKSLVAVPAAEGSKGTDGTSKKDAVLHAGLAEAQINGVCIVATQSLFGLDFTITVSSPDTKVSQGQNIFFDVTSIGASTATLSNTILGKSADDITINGKSMGGTAGAFGIDGTGGTVTLENVSGMARQAQIASSLTLPNLSIQVHPGTVDHC